jgi:hypothetical protein
VVKGLDLDCDKPCYSGRYVVLIFQVKINGEQFENGDREVRAMEAQYGRYVGGYRSVDHGRSRYCTYKNFNK